MKNNITTNIQGFIGCESSYEDANIVLFGAPFDGTVSYRPGTRFGPAEIRNQSFGIETFSPYQEKDLENSKVFDYGDLDFPMGNKEKVLEIIEDFTTKVVEDNKKPFMLGGEHLVTLGTVRALSKKYENLAVIQFDAHADLREDYLGEKLSHACVLKRCYDILSPNSIYQFGIRSMSIEEHIHSKHVYQERFSANTVSEIVEKLKYRPVYVTIDLDVLDPSVFPGTGTPEAGGLTYKELQEAMLKLRGLNIVGADINELSPHYDRTDVSTAVACKVLREMLLIVE